MGGVGWKGGGEGDGMGWDGTGGLRMRFMVGDLVLNWPWVDIVREKGGEG